MVALFDPEGATEVLEILEKTTGVPSEIYFAPKSWVVEAIEHYYFRPQEAESRNNTNGRTSSRKKNPSLRSTFVGERSRPRKANNLRNSMAGNTSSSDDLDDFLAEQPRSGKSSQIGLRNRESTSPSFGDMSGLGQGFWEDPNSSKWSWGDSQSQPPEEARNDFDLFNEDSVVEGEHTLQSVVEKQQERIVKLNEELKRQRDVIQVLADLLIEARVISARELKRRVRDKRK